MAIMQSCQAKLLWGLCILLTITAQLADSYSEYQKFKDLTLHRNRRQINCPHEKYAQFQGHTACLDASSHYVKGGMNDVDKNRIIHLHNDYRSKVFPTARDMQTLTWDADVEMVARKWAENCLFEHDSIRFIPGRFSVGQNLAKNHVSWDDVIKAWYIEYKDYIYGLDIQPTSKQVGHYTQLAWAKSGKIGCSYAECTDRDDPKRPNFHLYVCNYAPAGNVGSLANPYEEGPVAANCPGRTNIKFPSLCDCGGKVCENENIMDLGTCTCDCAFKFYVNDVCELSCDSGGDPRYCQSWGAGACLTYVNVPYECPKMCNICPYSSIPPSEVSTPSTPKPKPPTPSPQDPITGDRLTTTRGPTTTPSLRCGNVPQLDPKTGTLIICDAGDAIAYGHLQHKFVLVVIMGIITRLLMVT